MTTNTKVKSKQSENANRPSSSVFINAYDVCDILFFYISAF